GNFGLIQLLLSGSLILTAGCQPLGKKNTVTKPSKKATRKSKIKWYRPSQSDSIKPIS
ncbi:hypothetical protein M5D96_001036, partial [Drosophila gunungcola]